MNAKTLALSLILLGSAALMLARAGAAQVLPESVQLTYNVKLYDTELGNLVTRLTRDGSTYTVESETRAEGLASVLLGGTLREECKFVLSDSLELKPRLYSIEKEGSDPYKLSAEYFWEDNEVRYDSGRSVHIPLEGYVIDNCTVPYAFAAAEDITLKEYPYLHILGGKRLRHYEDIKVSRETVEVPAGTYEAIRIDQQRVDSEDKTLTVWVAPTEQNLAVKIEERRPFRVTTMELLKTEGLDAAD